MITGATLCSWNSKTGCSITPPPKSMTFVLLVSFIISIFVLFLDFLVGFIQTEYAAKRPNLESWGMNTESWLGSNHHKRTRDTSLVADAVSCQAPKDLKDEDHAVNDVEKNCKSAALEIGEIECDFISKEIYNDFLSPKEECNRLMTRVKEFLANDACSTSSYVNKTSQDAGGLSTEHVAAAKAISSHLMVNFDGTLKPLSFRQQIFCKDRQDWMVKKVKRARRRAIKICEAVSEMKVHDDNLKDIALMRKFILEQVSIFYQFSLKKNFDDIDGVPPEIIRPGVWVAAWFFIISVILFFLYWVFAWGVKNGGDTLYSWGTNYGVSVVQDCLICEVAKVCIMYVFAVLSAKPQLHVIKRIINDRALSLVQDGIKAKDEVSVVQHFSPACRAARLSGLSKLPASAILRSITDDDVEKCREHKNFTLGSVIFYTIMFAAVIAAVSEIFVDQLLSTVLSTGLLGFLLLHVKLIAISPLLLLGIYGILLSIIFYNLFLFGPSLKKARQARVKKAQAAKEFGKSKLSRKKRMTVASDLLRRFKKLKDYFLEFIGTWHAFISNEGDDWMKEKERHESILWCGMNRSFADQGNVASQAEVVMRFKSPHNRYGGFGGDVGDQIVEYIIPSFILSMRQSGSIFNEDGPSNFVENQMLTDVSNPFILDTISDKIPAVMKRSNLGQLARIYMANVEVTSDPDVALRRMLERHLLGAESFRNGGECNIFDLQDASDDFIFMSELTEMLSWSWGTFYPSGNELTSELKLEVEGLFQKWRKSAIRLRSCSNDYPDGLTGLWGANFSEFSAWFLSICDDIALQSIQVHQAEEYPISRSLTPVKEYASSDADSDCGNSVHSIISLTSEMT